MEIRYQIKPKKHWGGGGGGNREIQCVLGVIFRNLVRRPSGERPIEMSLKR